MGLRCQWPGQRLADVLVNDGNGIGCDIDHQVGKLMSAWRPKNGTGFLFDDCVTEIAEAGWCAESGMMLGNPWVH